MTIHITYINTTYIRVAELHSIPLEYNVNREIFIFPVQLTTCRTGNLTQLIHTLAICVTIHTYIQCKYTINEQCCSPTAISSFPRRDVGFVALLYDRLLIPPVQRKQNPLTNWIDAAVKENGK